MRFLHLGLVVSLVLSTKASDDPNHDDSVSENPTGRATVHGHPKVAAGSGRPKPISETPLMSREADSEKHTMPPVMTEDNAMMLSDELTNAHESNEALIEEMSEQDKVISVHEFKEVLHELVKDAIDKIVMKKAGIMGKLKTAKQNLIGQDGEATGRDPQSQPNQPLLTFEDIFICWCDSSTIDSLGPLNTQGNCNRQRRLGEKGDSHGRELVYLYPHEAADLAPASCTCSGFGISCCVAFCASNRQSINDNDNGRFFG